MAGIAICCYQTNWSYLIRCSPTFIRQICHRASLKFLDRGPADVSLLWNCHFLRANFAAVHNVYKFLLSSLFGRGFNRGS